MFFVRRAMFMVGIAGSAAGCVARTASPLNATANLTPGTLVMAQELAGTPQQGSLMDALQRLRPGWLQSRGGAPMVSVDGAVATELSSLRLISVSIVRQVRFERSSSSVGRATIAPNGDVVVGDLIVVTTGRRGSGER
jgi:hypothetical protein